MRLPDFFRPTAATRRILGLVAAWAVIINAFALVAWNRVNVTRDTAYGWIDPQHLHAATWSLASLPARWDSEWYLGIARDGYAYKGVGELSNIVFFPVYPLLMRAVAYVFGGNVALAGWLISLACLAAGAVVLAHLVREFHPKLDADEVVLMLLAFPTAIFFNAVYTEAFFFAVSVAAIYLARRRAWGWAAAFACVAALTRVTGVLLFLPLAIEAWLEWRETGRWRRAWLALAAIPAAAASFFAYHWLRFGDPLLFFKIEKTWGRSFTLNGEHFLAFTGAAQANLGLDVFFAVLALAAVVVIWRRVRPSYAVYALASLLLPIASGTLMSIGRYALVLFPIPMAFATLPPTARRAWLLLSAMLLGLYALLYAHSYWAG
jgi:hypothetical protein